MAERPTAKAKEEKAETYAVFTNRAGNADSHDQTDPSSSVLLAVEYVWMGNGFCNSNCDTGANRGIEDVVDEATRLRVPELPSAKATDLAGNGREQAISGSSMVSVARPRTWEGQVTIFQLECRGTDGLASTLFFFSYFLRGGGNRQGRADDGFGWQGTRVLRLGSSTRQFSSPAAVCRCVRPVARLVV